MADEIKKNNKHLINAPAGSGKTTYIRNQLKSICINKPESRIYVLHILIGRQTSLRKIWKMLILQ